jgi:flagellar hook-length control protein FliK
MEEVAAPRRAEPGQSFVDRALIELRATVSMEASGSELPGPDDATPPAADDGRQTEAMQVDGRRGVRPPRSGAIAGEAPPVRAVTPATQARDPLPAGSLREQPEGEARPVRAPRVKALLRFSEAQAPEAALVAPVKGEVSDSIAAVLPTRVAEVRSVRYHSALLDQIREGAIGAGQLSRVTIQLRPPELGSVAVAVESRDGRLYAHFHSTHPMVAGWLESNVPALRSQLAEAGLRLHDITLSTSTQEQGGRRDADHFPERDQWGSTGGRMKNAQASPMPPLAHRMRAADGLVDYFA